MPRAGGVRDGTLDTTSTLVNSLSLPPMGSPDLLRGYSRSEPWCVCRAGHRAFGGLNSILGLQLGHTNKYYLNNERTQP